MMQFYSVKDLLHEREAIAMIHSFPFPGHAARSPAYLAPPPFLGSVFAPM
jgi:hypothetical protein